MPLKKRDFANAGKIADEAEKFAGHLRNLPRDEAGSDHAELADVLRSFQRINGHLADGAKAGKLGAPRHTAIGREFQKMGKALSAPHGSRAKKR